MGLYHGDTRTLDEIPGGEWRDYTGSIFGGVFDPGATTPERFVHDDATSTVAGQDANRVVDVDYLLDY